MAVQRKRGLRFTWVRGVAVANDALGFGKLSGVQQTCSYVATLDRPQHPRPALRPAQRLGLADPEGLSMTLPGGAALDSVVTGQ